MITPFKVNRKVIRKDVRVRFLHEEEDRAPDYDDPEENKRISKMLADGDQWAWFCAHVEVYWSEYKAETYLGGCSYESAEAFKKDQYYEDMINECVEEIAQQIEATINTHGLLEVEDNPCLFCLAATL